MKVNYERGGKSMGKTHNIWIIKAILLLCEDLPDVNPDDIDISLLVNGNEINFLEFCDSLASSINQDLDRRIKNRAKKDWEKTLDGMCTDLNKIYDNFEKFIEAMNEN